MAIGDVTRERLLEALDSFDLELRNSSDWSNWQTRGYYRHAIVSEGRHYPVGEIVRMATGASELGAAEAASLVRARGFQVAELNPIRDSLEELLARYPGETAKPFGKSNALWGIFERLANTLRPIEPVASYRDLVVTWGAGHGGWTRVPWVAFLDSRETDSTQRGVYCALLFRDDMSGVYLTFYQGVTEPKRRYGAKARHDFLRARAEEIRRRCEGLARHGFRLDAGIDLRADRGIAAHYAVSTIAHKLYERGHVPPDAAIAADLRAVLSAYRHYVDGKVGHVPLRRGWIFQADPSLYDLAGALGELTQITWPVERRWGEIGAGDRVFLWERGPDPGVLAVATVLSEPHEMPGDEAELRFDRSRGAVEGPRLRVRLAVEGVPERRITPRALRAHPALSNATILRAAEGATVPLALGEQQALLELIGKSSPGPPLRYVREPLEPYRPDAEEPGTADGDAATPDLAAVHAAFAGATRQAGLTLGATHGETTRSLVASLATKPFVILTGLSGSGKTQVAIKLGQWLGPSRYLVVPVRPDWTGAEALFGYEDALRPKTGDGRGAWVVPAPLELMLRAAGDPEYPYLLVLDEMNLAHVERYFADALSGMESREPCLPNLAREDDGAWRLRPGADPRVPFPRNLFVIGTVNVDETTYLFSPKVLDRANVFELRVRTGDLSPRLVRPGPVAPGDPALVRGFVRIARDDAWHAERRPAGLDEYERHLRTLHGLLAEGGYEFGHRVFYEAMRFAVVLAAAGDDDPLHALDFQVAQKLLPRLHGSRRQLEATLCALGRFCFDLSYEPGTAEPGAAAKFDPVAPQPADARLPSAFDKVRRMTRSLRANQCTSFTE